MSSVETAAGSGLKKVSYRKPVLKGPRGIAVMAEAGTLRSVVQVLAEGARQGLHAHNAHNGIYLGLAGRVRFYGAGNILFAEIGPNEAVVVPRGTIYGFEAVGGDAQMFYVDAVDTSVDDVFFSHEAGSDIVDFDLFTAEGALLSTERLELG